jgi:hypothetical protein
MGIFVGTVRVYSKHHSYKYVFGFTLKAGRKELAPKAASDNSTFSRLQHGARTNYPMQKHL